MAHGFLSVLRFITPPIAASLYYRLRGDAAQRSIRCFQAEGAIPWSPGYGAYKDEFIRKRIHDSGLLRAIRAGAELPMSYGIGLDERCIEYPWVLANLNPRAHQILDAGSTLNFELFVTHSLLAEADLHILTLAPEPNCYWHRGISYVFGDLRDLPFRNARYDAIICISTLEHVGCDNRLYSKDERYWENSPESVAVAMTELARVLKRGGELLFTVPFGKRKRFPGFQQFDSDLLDALVQAFGPSESERTFFKYTATGWTRADAASCAECEYAAAWMNEPQWPDPIPVAPDRAAAARAVACVRVVKK